MNPPVRLWFFPGKEKTNMSKAADTTSTATATPTPDAAGAVAVDASKNVAAAAAADASKEETAKDTATPMDVDNNPEKWENVAKALQLFKGQEAVNPELKAVLEEAHSLIASQNMKNQEEMKKKEAAQASIIVESLVPAFEGGIKEEDQKAIIDIFSGLSPKARAFWAEKIAPAYSSISKKNEELVAATKETESKTKQQNERFQQAAKTMQSQKQQQPQSSASSDAWINAMKAMSQRSTGQVKRPLESAEVATGGSVAVDVSANASTANSLNKRANAPFTDAMTSMMQRSSAHGVDMAATLESFLKHA